MTSGKDIRVPAEASVRRYYDTYYEQGDFAHYPENSDLAYFHAIFMYFSIPRNSAVLDGGCGTGVRLQRMQRLGMRMTGIELSGSGLRICRNDDPGAQIVQGDMLQMPFRDAAFDAVITLGCSIVNSGDPALESRMAAEALRVTRPGGWVIATTVTDFSGTSPSGWTYRSRKSLETFSASVPAQERRIIYTAPRIATIAPQVTLHPLTSAIVERLPGYKRTVILGWRK